MIVRCQAINDNAVLYINDQSIKRSKFKYLDSTLNDKWQIMQKLK